MQREARGQFAKGTSGNPGGRPRALSAELRAAFQAEIKDMVVLLAKIARDDEAKDSDRIAAARALIENGLSKPAPESSKDDDEEKQDATLREFADLMKSKKPTKESR